MTRESNTKSSHQETSSDVQFKGFGHGKLRSKWEGPFKVIETSSRGAVTLQDDGGNVFKVNGQHLKVFHEPQNLEEIDMIEFLQFKDSNKKIQSCTFLF
jgi:hypothetical protein